MSHIDDMLSCPGIGYSKENEKKKIIAAIFHN